MGHMVEVAIVSTTMYAKGSIHFESSKKNKCLMIITVIMYLNHTISVLVSYDKSMDPFIYTIHVECNTCGMTFQVVRPCFANTKHVDREERKWQRKFSYKILIVVVLGMKQTSSSFCTPLCLNGNELNHCNIPNIDIYDTSIIYQFKLVIKIKFVNMT